MEKKSSWGMQSHREEMKKRIAEGKPAGGSEIEVTKRKLSKSFLWHNNWLSYSETTHNLFWSLKKQNSNYFSFIAFLPTSWIRWRSNKEWEKLLWWNWKLETWKFFKCIHSWNPTVVWKRLGFLKYHLTLYFLKNNY